MTQENKPYVMTVQFQVIELTCFAKNEREAKSKFYAKLRKKDLIKLLDKQNSSIQRY